MRSLLKLLLAVMPILGYAGQIHHSSSFNMEALKVNIVDSKEAITEVYLQGLVNDALVGSPILPTLQNQNLKANVIEDVYTPLLEENKEWRYNVVRWDPNDFAEGETRIYSLGETEIINEKEYYPLYITYKSGDETRTMKSAYLSEDIDNKLVYCIFTCENIDYLAEFFNYLYMNYEGMDIDKEFVLYDFNDMDNSIISYGMSKQTDLECMEYNGYKLYSVYHGFPCNQEDGVSFGIAEGIGILSLPPKKDYYSSSTLLGQCVCNLSVLPIRLSYPHLYEVIDGEGNQIYYDIDYAPGFSGINEALVDKKWYIDIDEENSQMRLYGATGEAALYDTTGKLVLSGVVTHDNSSLSLRGITPGMYILKIQDHVKKIWVR